MDDAICFSLFKKVNSVRIVAGVRSYPLESLCATL